jgi:hypothetical protein
MPSLETAAIRSPLSWDINDEWDELNEFFRYLVVFLDQSTQHGELYMLRRVNAKMTAIVEC